MKPRDTPCIFCAIVAGHVPCHVVYEDEHLLAFLDHRPLSSNSTKNSEVEVSSNAAVRSFRQTYLTEWTDTIEI